MLTNEIILKTIKAVPEEKFDNIDEVLEEIILVQKIENRINAADKAEILPKEDADKEISKMVKISCTRPALTDLYKIFLYISNNSTVNKRHFVNC